MAYLNRCWLDVIHNGDDRHDTGIFHDFSDWFAVFGVTERLVFSLVSEAKNCQSLNAVLLPCEKVSIEEY